MYRLTKTAQIRRLSDGALLPVDNPGYIAWLAAGNSPASAPALLPADIQTLVEAEAQRRLDAFARTRGYGGIVSLCSYSASKNPRFAAEAQIGVDLRDATWAKLYQILEQVLSGAREVPSSFAEIENEMPVLTWTPQS